jgi:hypothetical protein
VAKNYNDNNFSAILNACQELDVLQMSIAPSKLTLGCDSVLHGSRRCFHRSDHEYGSGRVTRFRSLMLLQKFLVKSGRISLIVHAIASERIGAPA